MGRIDAGIVATSIRDAVTRADMEEGATPVALALEWPDEIEATGVRAVAEGIRAGLPLTIQNRVPLVLIADQIVAQTLGATLKEELGIPGDLISMEGVGVNEFDFIDIGAVIRPANVVPITVKSLLFAGGLDRRSIKQALLAATKR
jgi:ethanolamine utilization protein EutA